jgi:hypothetical protein
MRKHKRCHCPKLKEKLFQQDFRAHNSTPEDSLAS